MNSDWKDYIHTDLWAKSHTCIESEMWSEEHLELNLDARLITVTQDQYQFNIYNETRIVKPIVWTRFPFCWWSLTPVMKLKWVKILLAICTVGAHPPAGVSTLSFIQKRIGNNSKPNCLSLKMTKPLCFHKFWFMGIFISPQLSVLLGVCVCGLF